MRLVSLDGILEIKRGCFDEPLDVDASVESQGYSGRVDNIFPSGLAEFCAELEAMERDNCGRAVLAGTEGFWFSVVLPKGNGDFWVEISMSAGFSGAMPATAYQPMTEVAERFVRCRFRVDGEYWSTLVSGMRAILAQPRASSS
jgi:hypothetical protein